MGLSAVRRDVVLCVLGAGRTPEVPAPAASEVGLVGSTYAGATKPTAEKPQSRLWLADGRWWCGSAVIAVGTAFQFGAIEGLEVRVETSGRVVVSLNGVTMWSTATASLGTLHFRRVLLGHNSTRRSYDLRIASVRLAR